VSRWPPPASTAREKSPLPLDPPRNAFSANTWITSSMAASVR